MRTFFLFLCVMFAAAGAARAGLAEASRYSASMGGVSFVAVENAVVLLEDYPNGGRPDRVLRLASGTKSFSGVIAAAAAKDGFLSLDERASDTLEEWRSDPGKSAITIRQILQLTSGVKSTGVGRAPSYSESVRLPLEHLPGSHFEYGPVNFQIFGEIMRRKLAMRGEVFPDAAAYLQARVLDPLGILSIRWNRGADGMPNLASGAAMTARDWARFGSFILAGGAADGRQIVDPAVFAAFTRGSSVNPAYGLTWWLNRPVDAKVVEQSRTMEVATDLFTHDAAALLPDDLFMAAGAGGQRLYIIPSRNLVVVRNHPRFLNLRDRFSDVEFLIALLDL